MKLLTIGITTYNNDPFFSELMYTISMQVENNPQILDSVEFMIVDDFSNSEFRVQLRNTPSYIKVHEQDKNYGTPAVGRNYIIKNAGTKYILFIDGDDNFVADIIDVVKELESLEADLVVSDVRKIVNDGIIKNSPMMFSKQLFSQTIDMDQVYKYTVHQTGIWNIYNLKFLKKNKIYYDVQKRYEDNFFNTEVYLCSPRIELLKTSYYGWRNNFKSFSHQSNNYEERLQLYKRIVKKLSETEETPIQPWLFYAIWNQTYVNMVRDYPSYPKNVRKAYYRELEKITKENKKSIDAWMKKLDSDKIDYYTKLRRKFRCKNFMFIDFLRKVGKLAKNKYHIVMKSIAFVMRPFPLKEKMFITSHYGNFNDNSKYLYLKLKQQKAKVRIVFAAKDAKQLNEEYKTNDFINYDNKLLFFWHHYTSKDIYFNTWMNPDIKKKEGQVWHQLWHGIPYKKVYKDIETFFLTNDSRDIIQKENNIKQWDIVYSVNGYNSEIFSKLFPFSNIKEEIYQKIKWLKEENKNIKLKGAIYKKYGLDHRKKIVLYAPTYRPYKLYIDMSHLLAKMEENEVLLIHMHPRMQYEFINNGNLPRDQVVQKDEVQDIQELILISDRLISDYSSIIFDFKQTGKSVDLYMPDLLLYEKIHGIYNLKELGKDDEKNCNKNRKKDSHHKHAK